MSSYGLDGSNYETKDSLWKQFPFLFHTYCTHNRRRATATPLLFFSLLFSDVSSTYKCYKKNPVSIQSTRWRNGNVRLFFILSSHPPHPPPRKRLKYLKQFTGVCTKGMGFFFFLFFPFCYNMKRKNRQDERRCIFTFRKNCRPPSGSKCDRERHEFQKKD